MSVPLERLYQYIERVSQEVRGDRVIIYHFYPHGSKNPDDIHPMSDRPLYDWLDSIVNPHVYCNDQEPLNFDFYQNINIRPGPRMEFNDIIAEHCRDLPNYNLRGNITNLYDHAILLHSEKHSVDLEKYRQANFITVYYWSHALIALDWFRYAEQIKQHKKVQKRFLIYNRAWSGTREYRLGFAQRLIWNDLVKDCLMRVSPVDSTIDKHYDLHDFERPMWRPTSVIEDYFPLCEAESHYSADFDINDYETTSIEIVLETLFDDQRLHLTEKTLRPIAMGQPFILAGTSGSLQYLRDYGFKTFSDCWDESYDMMTDSIERMNKIIEVMKNINSIAPFHREKILEKARAIADYNKKHFFSKEFQGLIESELAENFAQAFNEIEERNTGQCWLEQHKKIYGQPTVRKLLDQLDYTGTPEQIDTVTKRAQEYYIRTLKHNT